MKLAVLGGSGGTGLAFIEAALAGGHTVRALLRSPAQFALGEREGLALVQGDGMVLADVERALEDQDAVLVTVGGTVPKMHENIQRNVIQAMKHKGLRRMVIVTSCGIGEQYDIVPAAFRIIRWLFLYEAYKDKDVQEKMTRASELDWTIVRPSQLLNTPATGKYTIDPTNTIMPGAISRTDVAQFCLNCFTQPDAAYVRQTVSISTT